VTIEARSISTIAFPPPGAAVDRTAAADLAAQLRAWLAEATDRVFALDAQWQAIGPDASPDEQADVAAAFLAHQAIGSRIAAMGTADGIRTAGELCHRPVLADDGSPIAANLADACTLLEAVITRAETSLARTATAVHETVRLRSAITADLAVAEHLAERLGDQVRHVTNLRARATKALAALADAGAVGDASGTAQVQRLAADVAGVRAMLEAADADRRHVIEAWAAIPARLDELRAQETTVRALRTRCEDKVRPVPNLAVPSVDALGPPAPIDRVEQQPWPAVGPLCRAYMHRLDRVQAALDEVQRRFGAPLAERDELRGLVQAYHDKAGEAGLDEHTDLDPMYRSAADALWSAPCDLVHSRELVQRYAAAVNAITDGETARTTGDTPT
jgi:hypothetical protein